MPAIRILATLALLAAALTACGGSGASTSAHPGSRQPPGGVSLEVVAQGLDAPVDVAGIPGSDDLAVVEKTGRILVLRGGRVTGTMLDIRGRVSAGSEQGLLSVAFDPRYDADHRAYVDYTDTAGNTHIARLDTRSGRLTTILFVRQPYPNHNGGGLAFGPDGLLYVGLGDGGSEGDPHRYGQNRSVPLAKILRLDVRRAHPVAQMYAYGVRNPWRLSFDPATGDLWIGDVGQDHWEEIDRLAHGRRPGADLGWSAYEGRVPFTPQPVDRARLVWPVAVYSHDGGRCSVTGGVVYRRPDLPALRGRYVFGDFCSGQIWSMPAGGGPASRVPVPTVQALASFGVDSRGELYAVSLNGTVERFAAG